MRPEEVSSSRSQSRIRDLNDRYQRASAEVDRLLEEYGDRDGDIPVGQAEHLNRTIVQRDRAAAELRRVLRRSKRPTSKTRPGASQRAQSGPVLVRRRDPYNLSEIRSSAAMYDQPSELSVRTGPFWESAELRARAHDAIEQAPAYVTDEHRESAAQLVDSELWGSEHARHMLTHGSPRYTAAFFEYMRDGAGMSAEARSILGSTGAAGGYIASTWTDPTVLITSNGSTNPMRQLATVKTIPAGQTWNGVTSQAMVAEWATTATQFADGGPSSFVQPSITPQRADVHVVSSIELARDSDIGDQVLRLFADARDVLEGTAFVSGTGVNQPFGIVTKLATTTTSRLATTTSAALGPVDAYAALNALPARYVNNASWLSHWFAQSILRAQGAAQPGFIVDVAARTTLMLGMPYLLSSAMLNAGGTTGLSTATSSTDSVLCVADFASAYTVVDVAGLEVVVNDAVQGSGGRLSGQMSWSGFWRTGGDVTNASAAILVQA